MRTFGLSLLVWLLLSLSLGQSAVGAAGVLRGQPTPPNDPLYSNICDYASEEALDDAFVSLSQLVREDWEYVDGRIHTDIRLLSLKDDPRWEEIVRMIEEEAEMAGVNMKLRRDILAHMDSSLSFLPNLIQMARVYGFPTSQSVGGRAANYCLYLMQAADPQTLGELIPTLRFQAARGETGWDVVAVLTDQWKVKQGLPQVYGCMVEEKEIGKAIYPIEDEAHVNERRAEMGLSPLEEYARERGIIWVAPVQDRE